METKTETVKFKVKKLYVVAVVGILALVLLSIFQYYRNRNLRWDLKDKKEEFDFLQSTNDELNDNVLILERERDVVNEKIDSLVQIETYYKNKYYATNKKLKNILDNYDSMSAEDRWNALTKSLDN